MSCDNPVFWGELLDYSCITSNCKLEDRRALEANIGSENWMKAWDETSNSHEFCNRTRSRSKWICNSLARYSRYFSYFSCLSFFFSDTFASSWSKWFANFHSLKSSSGQMRRVNVRRLPSILIHRRIVLAYRRSEFFPFDQTIRDSTPSRPFAVCCIF